MLDFALGSVTSIVLVILHYQLVTKPQVNRLTQMRYDGFRADAPALPQTKFDPFAVRED